jgi:hypothetical protein
MEQRAKAFAEEAARRGCSVEEVAAEADKLANDRRARARRQAGGDDVKEEEEEEEEEEGKGEAGAGVAGEDDGLPPLEDVDVSEINFGFGQGSAPTQYAKDNERTHGLYNRELEAKGEYKTAFSSKTEATRSDANDCNSSGNGRNSHSVSADNTADEDFDFSDALAPGTSGLEGAGFEAASAFAGSRPGMVFRNGEHGLGYYRDAHAVGALVSQAAGSPLVPSPTSSVVSAATTSVEEREDLVAAVAAAKASTGAGMYSDGGGIDDLD